MAPLFRTLANVDIAHTGTWHASTGVATFTADDFDAAVAAADDPTLPTAIVKIGHTDPRWNGAHVSGWMMDAARQVGIDGDAMAAVLSMVPISVDGLPALGRVTNLRSDVERGALVADFVGVPGWLADRMPAAYPRRSIEADWGVAAPSGRTHGFAVSAVALLGETPPAVSSLADLRQWIESGEVESGDTD